MASSPKGDLFSADINGTQSVKGPCALDTCGRHVPYFCSQKKVFLVGKKIKK